MVTHSTQESRPDTEVRPIPADVQRRKLRNTALLAGALTLFCSQQSAGFVVIYIIIPQFVLIPMRLMQAAALPAERRLHLLRVAIWLAAVATIYLAHMVREDIHRQRADEIIAKIDTYTTQHGHCPAGIEQAGLNRKELDEKLGRSSYYLCDKDREVFSYPASFTVFHHWWYDFQRRGWHEHNSG